MLNRFTSTRFDVPSVDMGPESYKTARDFFKQIVMKTKKGSQYVQHYPDHIFEKLAENEKVQKSWQNQVGGARSAPPTRFVDEAFLYI